MSEGCFSTADSYVWGMKAEDMLSYCPNYIIFNYTLNGMPTSSNETRPKSKFFSLLIYAGYPIA